MRHPLLAAAMLVVALVITFGAASVLQDIAVARSSVQSEPFEVNEMAKVDIKTPAGRRPSTAP
jgi:hypothetical protein